MDSARWDRIQALFHEAAELPEPERRTFLDTRCGGDAALIEEVLSLLGEDAGGASVLDRGLAHLAEDLLDRLEPASLSSDGLGPYRIIRPLGEGGMGVVYLAERGDLGSVVAIKILRDAWLSPARRERFANERRTLAQLNHPSIAQLYDAGSRPDGTPWFAMEYVEGEPLTAYCDARSLSITERLRLFRSVCEAVQHAHRHAVIHRDLKPPNILVKQDGTVKLLDFGIAKQLETFDSPIDQTKTGMRLMTPAYAAPEQIRGDRIGIHTDVYALGVILYELLAGRLPFDLSRTTPAEAETIVVQQEPERPSAAGRARPAAGPGPARPSPGGSSWADLDVLCLTAMHKDPSRRYASVEALIRDIDHYLRGEPLEARPDAFGYRLGKFLRRNRRAVSLALVMSVMVVGLVVFFTVRLATARDAALAEATRTQRIQRFMLKLFEGDDEAAGPSDDLRVVTLLDRGVQEARALDAEPGAQADLYQTLGSIYQKLGRLDQAESLLLSSLERRRAHFGPEDDSVGESLVALALLRADQGRFEDAERLARDGLRIARQSLPVGHPAVARATTALGLILEDRGLYDTAIPVLQEAVSLQSEPGAPEADLAASLTELANTHFYAGHYEDSDAINRRVLEMDRRIYGGHHPHVADDLINLGAIRYEQGRYAEAEAFYRQALDIDQSFFGRSHHETASALTMLGRALVAQDKFDEARPMLQEALRVQERVYGEVHPRVASVLNELGHVAVSDGNLEEAERIFRRITDIYRSVYGDKHYLIGVAQANLADVYFERKEYDRAEKLYVEALRRYAETLPADHLNVGIARIRLGRSLGRQARYQEAAAQTLAGYEILVKRTDPPQRWVRSARADLATFYDALRQPDKAARFRAEILASAGGPSDPNRTE